MARRSEAEQELGLDYPTLVAHDIADRRAVVLVDDGWGVTWELIYQQGDDDAGHWIFDDGHIVPRGDKDPAARIVCEPPESLVDLGYNVLEAA